MKLNVTKVLATEEERKARPVPVPKVKVRSKDGSVARKPVQLLPSDLEFVERVEIPSKWTDKERLLDELNAERIRVLKDRSVLSSQIWKLVAEIEAKLRKENPGMVNAFLEGELPVPELADHAAKIEALTDQGAKLFDDIRYVEQHGKLPNRVESIPAQNMSGDVKAIQYEIRRLGDRVCKTLKKIRINRAKNPARIATWHEKVAFDEALIIDLKHKVKKLQYEARTERAGE